MTLTLASVLFGGTSGTFAVRAISCATVAWLIAATATWAIGRWSVAAVRHRIWALSCLFAVVIVLMLPVLPQWRVGPVRIEARTAVERLTPAGRSEHVSPDNNELLSVDDGAMDSDLPALVLEKRVSSGSVATDVAPPQVNRDQLQGGSSISKQTNALQVWKAFPLLYLLCLCWCIPSAWLLIRQLASIRAARRLVLEARPIAGEGNVGIGCLAILSKRLRIARLPLLVESDRVVSPICVGLFRSCILLPGEWKSWPGSQLNAVLTHELAHVVRRDVLWQMIARLAAAIYWFHPLSWVAAWRMRVERELACDDWVLTGGQASAAYARWLLDFTVAAGGRAAHCAGSAGVAMAAGGGFEKRVAAILDSGRRRSPVSRRAAIFMGLAASILAIVTGVINPWASRATAADVAAAKPAILPSSVDPMTRVMHLAGRTEDEHGQPIAGVFVEVSGGWAESPARSDAQGRFAVELKGHQEQLRYITARATTADGAMQTFEELYDPKGNGEISDESAGKVRLVLKAAREFPVTVKDHQGQPVAGAWIAFSSAYRKAGEARTDAAGKAILRVPADAVPMHVMASKSGVGLDYILFWRADEVRTDPYRLAPDYAGPLSFVLDGAKTIKVKVVDDQNHPLSGVKVRPWYFQKPKHGDMCNQGLNELARVTDAVGVATFDYIPADLSTTLVLWTTLEGYSSPRRCMYEPTIGQTSLETTMLRQVHLSGRVLDDAGRPAAGATVRYSGSGMGDDPRYGSIECLVDGTFNLLIDADKYYMLTADKGRLAAKPQFRMVRRESPAQVEFALAPGARIFGKANGEKGEAMPRASVSLILRDIGTYYKLPVDQQFPAGAEGRGSIAPSIARHITANEQGVFEFYTAPGKYSLFGYGPPSLVAEHEVKVAGQEQVEVNLRPNEASLARRTIPGRVVLGDKLETGVADASVSVYSTTFDNFSAVSDKQGNFMMRAGKADMFVHAVSDDKKMGGISRVSASETAVTIPIGPTASATGRLVDFEGTPVAGRSIQYGFRIGTDATGYTDVFGQTLKTGIDGTFNIEGLVPGTEYRLSAGTEFAANGEPRAWQSVGVLKAERAEHFDLGDRKLPKPRIADQPKSWKDHEADAFAMLDPIDKRLIEARERARAGGLHVLVVMGGPGRPGCDEFFEFANDPARYEVRRALADYTVIAVNTFLTETDALIWAERAKVVWPAPAMTLAVLDVDGKVVGQSTLKSLAADDKLDRKRLIEFLDRNAPKKPAAQNLNVAEKVAEFVPDIARTGFRPELKLPVLTTVAWRIRMEPTQQGGRFHWPSISDPTAAGGVVYFGDDNGMLRAVRSKDGSQLWTYEHQGRLSTPFVDDERVYFTTDDGLAAVKRSDGKPAWQFAIEGGASEMGGVVLASSDTLYCGGRDGFVYAIDRRNGKQRWKHSVVADAPADPPGFDGGRARFGKIAARPTGIATDGTTIFQSVFDQSRVVALDCATGEQRWAFQTGGWILGSAAVGEGHIYIGSQDKRLYCLDKTTGKQVWSFPTRSRIESTPGLADGRVYIASCDGNFYCVDAVTGKEIWSFATDAGGKGMRAIYSMPIITSDAVYFAAGEGQVYALDRAAGKLIWKLRPSESSELFSSPATDGVRVFVTTRASFDESGETSMIAVGP